ncbi:NAD(P)H-dependent oxidoreductase, partial [Thermodesulfobacteriota bacterium]
LQDNMAELLEKFMKTDIAVMATPVYGHNVTGIMKTFLDRMTPIIDPHLVKMEDGSTGHIKRYDEYPKFGAFHACDTMIYLFFRQQNNLYFCAGLFSPFGKFIDYDVCVASFFMDDKPPIGSLVNEYKQNVRKAAKEVVENMKISETTAQKLEQLFIPEEVYIEQANKYWDSRIAHYEESQE